MHLCVLSDKSFKGIASCLALVAAIVPSLLFVLPAHAQSSEDKLVEIIKKLKGDRRISLTVLYPEGSLPNVEVVAERFTNLTQIPVNTQSASVDDINTKLTIDAMRGKTSFDVALPATFGIPDLVKSGVLYDVSALARKYEAEVAYRPSLYETGNTYKGKQYGYQTDGDTYLMFFNQNWLNSAEEQASYQAQFGQPLQVPRSWQELDRQMAFFHRPENGQYGGMLFRTPTYMVWEWWLRSHEKGLVPFDKKMRALVNKPEAVAALKEMIDASDALHPSVSSNGLVENWEQYAKASSYANIGWGGTQKYLQHPDTPSKGTFISAPTPGFSYFNWGWSYVVSNFSNEKELAYLFTLFATLPTASTLAVKANGFFDPFREEHYQDPDIIKRYSKAFLAIHRETMENPVPDLYIEGRDQYISVLQDALVSAMQGYVSPQEALDYAARQWDMLTESLGREEQIKQWRFLRAQYPGLPVIKKGGTNKSQ